MSSALRTSSCRHRRRHPRGAVASGGFGCPVALRRLSSRSNGGGGGAATTSLAARPPTAEEMDAEWEGILASDDDKDEDDEDEDEEDEDDDLMLTDEELLAADATEGGYLGAAGEEEEEEEEGLRGGGAAEGKRRKPRVWYDSYKARMKAEKAKEAAWQEKRKTFSKAHNDFLDESQRNREIAAARYVVYVRPSSRYSRRSIPYKFDAKVHGSCEARQTGDIRAHHVLLGACCVPTPVHRRLLFTDQNVIRAPPHRPIRQLMLSSLDRTAAGSAPPPRAISHDRLQKRQRAIHQCPRLL